MATDRSQKLIGWIRSAIVIVAVLVVSSVLFEIVIQPILVSIDPAFSDKYAEGVRWSGRYPDSPAGIAFFLTYFVGFVVYALGIEFLKNPPSFKNLPSFKIPDILKEIGVLKFVGVAVLVLITTILPKNIADWILDRF